MDITTLKYGDLVNFGRPHGEKTLGRVLKVNRKTVKVEQLEARGQFRSYRVGTKWNLAPVFVERAPEGAKPQAVTKPENTIVDERAAWGVSNHVTYPGEETLTPEQAAMRAEIARLRAENEFLKNARRVSPPALPPFDGTRRPEAIVLNEIRNCYSALSPENLWMDGEATRAQARARATTLNRKLRALFVELGRRVSEDEVFA